MYSPQRLWEEIQTMNKEERKKAIDCEKSNLFSTLFRHAKNKNTYFWIFYHMSISYLIIE
jgi:hypothetical protein